jgi:glycine/D-amino acid oxidase-like deaminating enzyme
MDHFYNEIENPSSIFGCNTLFKCGFSMKFEGQVHSGHLWNQLKLKALNLGVEFYCGHQVESYHNDKEHVTTVTLSNGREFKCNQLILCSNSMTSSLVPGIDIVPGRGQVLITKPLQQFKLRANVHYNEGYIYFRNVGNQLLIGGARNIDFDTEATTQVGVNQGIINHLVRFSEETFLGDEKCNIESKWSGIMAFTKTKQVVLERKADGIVVAAGLNGMGIAMGAEIGFQASQLALQKKP